MAEINDVDPTADDINKDHYYREINIYYSKKPENSSKKPWTENRIIEVIQILKTYKNPKPEDKRENKHYNYGKKYDFMEVGGIATLIFKRQTIDEPIIQIISVEKYYDKLLNIHRSLGHGGRDKMLKALKDKYFIPRAAVEIFIKLCKVCNCKKSLPKKGIVVRPILSRDFNVRGQIDLIDLQSTPDKEFKWLMNYQDHSTKFLHLRPLKTKRAIEVALELLKIFLEFGAPHILQSDNGREFTASIIKQVTELWPDCKIVHGRPRNPKSQGSVERSNQDVENMLRAWMEDNNCTNWSIGCYFVQFQKNSSFHRTINRAPYKALFGSDPKVGLSSSLIPKDILCKLYSEEDLEEILNEHDKIDENDNNNETHCVGENNVQNNSAPNKDTECDEWTDAYINLPITCFVCNKSEGSAFIACSLCQKVLHCSCVLSDEAQNALCHMCSNENKINRERSETYVGQKKAAEKMLEYSDKKFKPIEVGSCVTVAVPKVDRGPLDKQNLLGQVVEFKNGVYRIATESGVLKNWLPRSEIQPCQSRPPCIKVPENQITLREAATLESKFGGQGFLKCACRPSKSQCNTKRCCCKKSGMMCNSRCHGSGTCGNK